MQTKHFNFKHTSVFNKYTYRVRASPNCGEQNRETERSERTAKKNQQIITVSHLEEWERAQVYIAYVYWIDHVKKIFF